MNEMGQNRSMEATGTAVHAAPIWRDKVDYIFMAAIPDSAGSEVVREQLWGRRTGPWTFEVCCIPFFIYGVALGDVVETDEASYFQRVVEPSGHAAYRAWFGSVAVAVQGEVIAEVERLGGSIERSSANLVAIDAPTQSEAGPIVEALTEFHERGMVVFEIGAAR